MSHFCFGSGYDRMKGAVSQERAASMNWVEDGAIDVRERERD